MSSNPNNINYVVTYDSDINSASPIYLGPLTSVVFQRNIAPSEDNATITIAGIQDIESAREIYIYRQNSDGTTDLKFRGMTTNPTYDVSAQGLVTTVMVQSLWYMLSTRLFQIAGKSPPPLQPNTNPYIIYLNPTLGLNFGQLWANIVVNAFQGSYTTGHLPPFHLANLDSSGVINPFIPQGFTDFDDVVVNWNANIQYMSISAFIDKLVQSSLFNSNQGQPFLAEYRLDIGDFPYTSSPDTVKPLYPTVTVMLFDPVHSKLGNGNNRTGLPLGDNSLDPYPTSPANLLFPMDYVEFGVTNGYLPIDTIVFSEGDNIVSVKLTYDYLSMNNSYVLTGGSFQGSDVVALPINNQRSIVEYGLKQTSQPLNNVVDTAEIQRYVGTSINFFQHPIPNIIVKPDYVYASSHILYAGDYVLLNTPSLRGVVKDSNGNVLEGSYVPGSGTTIVTAYTARIKTIDITWNPTDGEDITLTFTFPIMNVPLIAWNTANNTQNGGSNAGGLQSLYTTVTPAVNTVIGKGRGQEGAALYQTGGDFLSNRGNPFTEDVIDGTFESYIAQDAETFAVPIYAQIMPNLASVVTTSGTTVKGDSALIYQLGFEVNTINSTTQNTTNTPNDVYLTILQPDGMAIFDSILPLNQAVNILTLISQSHSSPSKPVLLTGTTTSATTTLMADTSLTLLPNAYIGDTLMYTSGPAINESRTIVSNTSNTVTTSAFSPAPTLFGGDTFSILGGVVSSAPLISSPSGLYLFIFRNAEAFPWISDPLFSFLPYPTLTGGLVELLEGSQYLYCPVNSSGNEFGMSIPAISGTVAVPANHINLSWPAVAGAVSYNIYRAILSLSSILVFDMLQFGYLANTGTASYVDTGTGVTTPNTQPFDTTFTAPTGFQCQYNGNLAGAGYFHATHNYWYMVTAVNPENIESESSQAITVFTGNNSVAQPNGNQVGQSATPFEIDLNWPSVLYAQSYNIYRADGGVNVGGTTTMPMSRSSFELVSSAWSSPPFTDDGVTYTAISGSPPPPDTLAPTKGNNTYTAYANYSFNPNPAFSKTISAFLNSPATNIANDPTTPRIFLPAQYVSSGALSSVSVYGTIGSLARGNAKAS